MNLQALARIGRLRRFAGGSTVCEEGEPGGETFIILSGNVRVMRGHPDGDVELAQSGPGDFFGEMSLLQQMPRSAPHYAGMCRDTGAPAEEEQACRGAASPTPS